MNISHVCIMTMPWAAKNSGLRLLVAFHFKWQHSCKMVWCQSTVNRLFCEDRLLSFNNQFEVRRNLYLHIHSLWNTHTKYKGGKCMYKERLEENWGGCCKEGWIEGRRKCGVCTLSSVCWWLSLSFVWCPWEYPISFYNKILCNKFTSGPAPNIRKATN